jgi:hypothetical protein
MQLKIQRSQRAGGLTASTTFFCLDVRAEYSPEEQSNIGRYKLGNQIIYNSQAARRHLEKAGSHLDRVSSDSMREKAAGLARGALSLALSKMQLNISIASLGRGHHIECKDLEELLEAEDTVRTSCKNLTRYLQVAETFDGSELVVEYVNGEEQIHLTPHAPPLLEYSPSASGSTTLATSAGGQTPTTDFEQRLKDFWANPAYRKLVYYGAGAVVLFLLLRSCFG